MTHGAEQMHFTSRLEMGVIFDLIDRTKAKVGCADRVLQIPFQGHDGKEECPAGLFQNVQGFFAQRHRQRFSL